MSERNESFGSHFSFETFGRFKNSNSGIISTTSGGKLKKVTVVWNSNTANGRTLNVYGSNTAYTAATDLYNSSKQGTLLGTIAYGTSTELTVSGDYAYIGLRSASGAMYLTSVTITWDASTYTDYCTTITEDITVSTIGWATYCSEYALDFTDVTGLTAYTAQKVGDAVKFNKVEGKVPANTGLLISGVTTAVPVAANADNVDNLLVGVVEDTPMAAGIFVLMKESSGLGFYKTTQEFTVRANSAYLPATVAGARSFIAIDEEATGIAEIETMRNVGNEKFYNLKGQRVAQPTKGLYIVNGKKYIVK